MSAREKEGLNKIVPSLFVFCVLYSTAVETRDVSWQLTHLIWGEIYGEDIVAEGPDNKCRKRRDKKKSKKKKKKERKKKRKKKERRWMTKEKYKRIEGRDPSQSPSAKRYKYANVRVWDKLLSDRCKTSF